MDDDYVNKQIVCPLCGGRDVIYIDLNEIRDDPKGESGTVTRTFSHLDHLLLLDIDYNGDIRTINQIDKKQEITINQEKYQNIINLYDNLRTILLISDDSHMPILFQKEIDNLDPEISYTMKNEGNTLELDLPYRNLVWVKPGQVDVLSKDTWEFVLVEYTEATSDISSDIIEICSKADTLRVGSMATGKTISEAIGIDEIAVL